MSFEKHAAEDSVEDRREAVARVGSALRATMLALIESEVAVKTLSESADQLNAIAAELEAVRRGPDQLASVDHLKDGIQMFSPVRGQGNPQAPPLLFSPSQDGVTADFTFDRRFEGPPGHVHGGQAALLLDEALAQAMLHSGRWGLTVQLDTQYTKAIPIGTTVVFSSEIAEAKGRGTIVTGGIFSPDRLVEYVKARAVFVSPRWERHNEYFGRLVDSSGRQASAKLESSE